MSCTRKAIALCRAQSQFPISTTVSVALGLQGEKVHGREDRTVQFKAHDSRQQLLPCRIQTVQYVLRGRFLPTTCLCGSSNACGASFPVVSVFLCTSQGDEEAVEEGRAELQTINKRLMAQIEEQVLCCMYHDVFDMARNEDFRNACDVNVVYLTKYSL